MAIVVEKHIQAPPDRVFAIMTDFRNGASHIPAISKMEMLTTGPVGVGTKFNETRKMFGKEATETMEVTKFDPPRSFALGAESCGAIYDTQFAFGPEAGGTKMTVTMNIQAVSFFAKLFSPLSKLFSGMMVKCFEADLNAVKELAERGQSPSAV